MGIGMNAGKKIALILLGFAGWFVLFAVSVFMLNLWGKGVAGIDNFENASPPWFLAWSAAVVVYGIIFSNFWGMKMRKITAEILKWVAWLWTPVVIGLGVMNITHPPIDSFLWGNCFVGILFVPFLLGNMCCSVCPDRKGAFKLYYTGIGLFLMALVVYSAMQKREGEKKK